MTNKLAVILLASAATVGAAPLAAHEAPAITLTPAADAASAEAECTATQSECLNQWFEAKFQESLAESPIQQTALGLKTNYDKIDDLSIEAEERNLQWMRDATAEMKATFDYDQLTDDAKLSWYMWLFRMEEAERSAKFRDQQYILTQMGGAHVGLPSFLLGSHRVDTESDLTALIARVGGLGRAMDQLLKRAQNNAEAGTRPPRFAYDAVIAESGKLISGYPFIDADPETEASAIWTTIEGHLAKLLESEAITEARADELREEARTAMRVEMAPAYARIIAWYSSDRPNTDEVAKGAMQLPNGEAFYKHSLKSMTTTDLTADEVHNLGLAEVARIRGEMEAIIEKVGFEGTLQEFFVFTRDDPQFFFSNDEKGAQDYIDRATMHIDELTKRLPEFFGRLPKAPLEVRRVEPFREQDGAAQHYRPGTPDGSRPGVYYAHLSDMTAMPIPPLEAIAYHEGNPGHHMQLSIAQELEGVPKFRSLGSFLSAYGEGWALYAEELAKEMGGYQDPYSDFGRLQSEMWRAIRLVVDTGIHTKGWTEDEAVAYCLENSPNPETVARSEVQRYFVLPAQATSYKIGMIRIQQLRAKAEAELGDKFDIRGFHDTVLGGGSVPLSLLEKQIDQWIASVKAS